MIPLLLVLIIAACLVVLYLVVALWLEPRTPPPFDYGADFKYVEPLSPSAREARTQAGSERGRR